MKMETAKVTAAEVEVGHFIPGIDNAYVIDREDVDEFTVKLTANDSNGDELYLEMPSDSLITIGVG